MQYLLDTHTFLWFINGDAQLSDKAQTIIENPIHERYISIASFWEMAIKRNLGKLELDMSFKNLYQELDKNGFSLLPITAAVTHLTVCSFAKPWLINSRSSPPIRSFIIIRSTICGSYSRSHQKVVRWKFRTNS